MKKKTKIILLVIIIIILITIGVIYLLYEKSLYSSSEFTVANINNNILEVTRIEEMPIMNENNEIIIGKTQRIYRINIEGIEIKDINGKKIDLLDLRKGDLIEVTQKIEPNKVTKGNTGEITYIEDAVSIKVLNKAQ